MVFVDGWVEGGGLYDLALAARGRFCVWKHTQAEKRGMFNILQPHALLALL